MVARKGAGDDPLVVSKRVHYQKKVVHLALQGVDTIAQLQALHS